MASNVLREILTWSKYRPTWQRDALRRIFTQDKLTSTDINDLSAICKGSHGLNDPVESDPLAAEHLAIDSDPDEPVSLSRITHHEGVNALASEQTISFGGGLTVVFGENSAGKSGYTRVLKRACRARVTENILGNVLSSNAPITPRATIAVRKGSTTSDVSWTPKTVPSDDLAAVCVFDAHCVPVYLQEKTEVAFRPFGLDTFDRLSEACDEVRQLLEKERTPLNKAAAGLPQFPQGTKAKLLVDNLSALTSVESVRGLASLSDEQKTRLRELRKQELDFKVADPKKLARELMLKADRVDMLSAHLSAVKDKVSDNVITAVRTRLFELFEARSAAESLQQIAITADLLPGTGGETWKYMWAAAARFSENAYPKAAFPQTGDGSRCLLCQQPIGAEAANRLTHFAEYALSAAQTQLVQSQQALNEMRASISSLIVRRSDLDTTLKEVTEEDPDLATEIDSFLDRAANVQSDVKSALDNGTLKLEGGVSAPSPSALTPISSRLRERANQLQVETPAMSSDAQAELLELTGRELLNTHLATALAEIERKKQIAAYNSCIDDTNTKSITIKSSELTKELVTDTLRNTFQDELKSIDFTHLEIEIAPAGGTKGVLLHHLVFTHAPSVSVMDVLSEGEARALSLAAFLTELSTAPTKSAIVFDDPVSSLDHVWRERIARRLAGEAADRQVIVFTHDLLFLHYLIEQAAQLKVAVTHQYIRRHGLAGICLPDLPWLAMSTKERLGVLRKRLQSAEKTFRTSAPETYESEAREIYGLMREAWEQALSEVLLNSVVERYRPSIQTNRAKDLHDITKQDCEILEREMGECSRWIRGHAAAAADGTPLPKPDEVKARMDSLESWVKDIRSRR